MAASQGPRSSVPHGRAVAGPVGAEPHGAGHVRDRGAVLAQVDRDEDVVAPPPRPHPFGGGPRRVGTVSQRGQRPAQGQQVAGEVQRRARIGFLVGDGPGRRGAEGQPRLDAGGGEPAARRPVPRHRGPRRVAVQERLEPQAHRVEEPVGRQVGVGQPELVAVVQDGGAAKPEQQDERRPGPPRVSFAPACRVAGHVVVAHRPARGRVGRELRLGFLDHGAEGVGLERREDEREVERQLQLVAVPVEGGDLADVEHVGLTDEEPRRVVGVADAAPAAQHLVHLGSTGVVHAALTLEPVHPVLGAGGRWVVAKQSVLDDHVAHVDAEPGDTTVEPEPQDAVELVPDRVAPPVEVGLLHEEMVQVALPGAHVGLPGGAEESADPVVGWPAVGLRVRPHVPVPMLGVAARAGVHEPRVLHARVVRHQVEEHAQAEAPSLGDQRVEVVEGPEVRMHAHVVGDVIAPVGVRRRVHRAEPHAVDPEPGDMGEVRGDAGQIADPVAVGVGERPRIDLVQHRVPPPVGHDPGG